MFRFREYISNMVNKAIFEHLIENDHPIGWYSCTANITDDISVEIAHLPNGMFEIAVVNFRKESEYPNIEDYIYEHIDINQEIEDIYDYNGFRDESDYYKFKI